MTQRTSESARVLVRTAPGTRAAVLDRLRWANLERANGDLVAK